jgi:signal transduction histidine kinase
MHVRGASSQLRHAIHNLVGNAVEAARPGGRVVVELKTQDPGRVLFEVSDSGPGPPPMVADRLFEPFITGKPEGVGLGLALARQVVEAHEGTITWRRENDQTCFRIDMPQEPQPCLTS